MNALILLLACMVSSDTGLSDSGADSAGGSASLVATPDPTWAAPDPVGAADPVRAGCPIAVALEAGGASTRPAPSTSAAGTVALVEAPPDRREEADAWIAANGALQYMGEHRMQTGETAWALSQAIGVPVWVLRALNPGMDLDHLPVDSWVYFPITSINDAAASEWMTQQECGC